MSSAETETNTLGELQRYVLILNLISELQKVGSWCGETHIQKAIYFVQNLSGINFGYEFILYKHGPFSFQLSGELAIMRSFGIVDLYFPIEGYGPSFKVTEFGENLIRDRSQESQDTSDTIEFISDWFGQKDVRELERLATAHFVTVGEPTANLTERLELLMELKPHIKESDAKISFDELSERISDFRDQTSQK